MTHLHGSNKISLHSSKLMKLFTFIDIYTNLQIKAAITDVAAYIARLILPNEMIHMYWTYKLSGGSVC